MENPDLKEANKQDSMNPNRKILLICSGILWLASLVMVGFYCENSANSEPIFGWHILTTMLYAWIIIIPYGAVYANIFYFIAFISCMWNTKKDPNVSTVLMLILATFTCFVSYVPVLEGKLEITAWGYGAFVWGFSLILLAGAAWDKRSFRSFIRILLPYLSVFAIIMLKVCFIKYSQWQHANDEERQKYLPLGAAFGVMPPPPPPPPPPPLPRELPNNSKPLEVVGDIDIGHQYFSLFSKEARVEFQLPDIFLYKGYLVDQRFRSITFTPSTLQANYRYQIESHDKKNATESLYDVVNQQTIWSNKIENVSDKNVESRFGSEIRNLFPIPKVEGSKELPKEIVFTEKCPLKPIPDELKNIQGYGRSFEDWQAIHLDNRVIYEFHMSKNDRLICHPDWVLQSDNGYRTWIHYLYQRNPFHKIAIYEIEVAKLPPAKDIKLLGKFRLSNDKLIIPYILKNDERGEIIIEKYTPPKSK